MYAISRLHGISVDQIAQMNDIAAPYVIHPGQRLFVDHKLIAVESTTSVEGTEGEPDTPIASVATRDGSSTSVNTSTPASSGITVTKLPRPPKRQEAALSNTSQTIAASRDSTDSKQQTSRNSASNRNKPSTEKTPASLPTKEAVTQSSGAQKTPEPLSEDTPQSVKPASSTPSSDIADTSNTPQLKAVSSSSSESAEAETPSFVARTEPTDATAQSSAEVDIDSLPKGWTWPISANPTNSFGKDDGLNYFLNQGNQVVAAASGRVTYAGVALGDFKYMVLIKTPDEYVIQYDFNSDLTVKENDLVSKGQDLIKIVNSSKGQQNTSSDEYRRVFFAIWKKGVPQNPNKLIGKPKTGES